MAVRSQHQRRVGRGGLGPQQVARQRYGRLGADAPRLADVGAQVDAVEQFRVRREAGQILLHVRQSQGPSQTLPEGSLPLPYFRFRTPAESKLARAVADETPEVLAEVEIEVPARHAYAILHKPHCTRTADSLILGIAGHTVGLSNRTTNVYVTFHRRHGPRLQVISTV